MCSFLSTEGLLSHSQGIPPSPGLTLAVPGLLRVIQAVQLYLQIQEMGTEEGIPALGLDTVLLCSDPCRAIPRGISVETAAGAELGRIFSLAIRVPPLFFSPVKEIPQSRDLEWDWERPVTKVSPSSMCQPQALFPTLLPTHHHCSQLEGGITCQNQLELLPFLLVSRTCSLKAAGHQGRGADAGLSERVMSSLLLH